MHAGHAYVSLLNLYYREPRLYLLIHSVMEAVSTPVATRVCTGVYAFPITTWVVLESTYLYLVIPEDQATTWVFLQDPLSNLSTRSRDLRR
jgi:hypothetical protein